MASEARNRTLKSRCFTSQTGFQARHYLLIDKTKWLRGLLAFSAGALRQHTKQLGSLRSTLTHVMSAQGCTTLVLSVLTVLMQRFFFYIQSIFDTNISIFEE